MNKRIRQYIGLFLAILSYYVIHEGVHFLYAICIGVFKQINFMGLGIQVDVYSDKMNSIQMGVFCIVGSVATVLTAYILVIMIPILLRSSSKVFKACMYYITIAMLLIDPIYLSILYRFFGGGDMNGILLLIPEVAARIIYGGIFIVNIVLFFKVILPKYEISFQSN